MSPTTQLGKRQQPRSKVNCKVKYHHHVRHVGHLGHFLHVPHVGHLHITAHAQCYNCLSILCTMQYYNNGLMQLERRKVIGYKLLRVIFTLCQTGLNAAPYAVPTLLVVRLSPTNIHSIKLQFLSSRKR